jgi:CheY-like chemotaxis protein
VEEYIDLVMEVEDTGIGISKEYQDLIFESFQQQDGQLSKKFGGTGLGLAISKRLVGLMNGNITVTSELNKGSKFRISIPDVAYLRDFERSDHQLQIDMDSIVFEEANVLVIDDVEHNRKYLSDALSDTQLKVTESDSGHNGYELAQKIVPDVIIVDIRMPGMDGFEFLEKVKRSRKLKHIPVIAYSASVLKAQKERIMKSDFTGFIMKPVQIAELYIELMNNLPHKKIEAAGHDIEEESRQEYQVAEIQDYEQLISSLKTEMTPKWETFSKRQPRQEIKEFAVKLIELGNTHNAGPLSEYGNKLIAAIDGFNIESMLVLLKKFPAIVKTLGSNKQT